MTRERLQRRLAAGDLSAATELYALLRRTGDQTHAEALATEIRAAVVDRGDRDAWLALGGILELDGDPRGELIALSEQSRGLGDDPDVIGRMAQLTRLKTQWIGPELSALLEPRAGTAKPRLRWRHGHVVEAIVEGVEWSWGELEHWLEVFFASPASALLSRLEVRVEWGSLDQAVDAIAAGAPPTLRNLRVGGLLPSSPSWLGRLDPLVARPTLRSLEANGDWTLESSGETLSELTLGRASWTRGALQPLAAPWPALRVLSLGGTIDNHPGVPALGLLEPLLDGTATPALDALCLRSLPFADALVGELCESALLERIGRVELRGPGLTAKGIERLLAHAERWARLDALAIGTAVSMARRSEFEALGNVSFV